MYPALGKSIYTKQGILYFMGDMRDVHKQRRLSVIITYAGTLESKP